MRLHNKVAVVTGAASGNGKEIALLFAKEGASVVLGDLDDKQGAEVAKQIEQEHGTALFFHCDVTCPEEAKALIETAVSHFGKLDILVNNAGIGLWGTVETLPVEAYDKVMNVNVRGTYLMSSYAVKAMRENPAECSIVNIGSAVGLVGCANSAAYCASKGAVANLTRAMAIDHGKDGIRVNCVCPGVVDTPFNDYIVNATNDPEAAKASQAAGNLLNRLQKPQEVAMACLFLASDESSYCTGSMLVADAGVSAK